MKTCLIDKARNYAKMAHKGQVRKFTNGDYFTEHCEVVAQYVNNNMHDLMPKQSWKGWFQPKLWENVIASAYLHDVEEDTKYTLEDFPITVREIVQTLTRKTDENYFEYICRIQDCGPLTVACRAIKIADLRCNMKDLQEGSMKDKYRFAEEILTRGLHYLNNDTEYHMKKIYEISGPTAPLMYMKEYYQNNTKIYNTIKKLIKDIENV